MLQLGICSLDLSGPHSIDLYLSLLLNAALFCIATISLFLVEGEGCVAPLSNLACEKRSLGCRFYGT